jgi:mannose-6-phosphate isomerase
MANSDNVLRCGLTPKHVDVPELLRVLDFHCGPPTLVAGQGTGPVTTFAPSEHFSLTRFAVTDSGDGGNGGVGSDAAEQPVPVGGPRILVTVEGAVRVRSERGQERVAGRGEALWIPACDGAMTVAATERPALAFIAADGLDRVRS